MSWEHSTRQIAKHTINAFLKQAVQGIDNYFFHTYLPCPTARLLYRFRASNPDIPACRYVNGLGKYTFFCSLQTSIYRKKTNFRQKKTAIDTRQPYHTWALVAEVLCLDCSGEIKIGNPNKRNRQIIYLRSILNSTMDKMQTNIRCT